MKGLPGSGKSTLCSAIKKLYPNVSLCSADYYVIYSESYIHDWECIAHAHSQCQTAASEAMKSSTHLVVIDNCFIRNSHKKFYVDIAKKYCYILLVVEPKTSWKFDVDKLSQRNIHYVSREVLEKKLKAYQHISPLFYAWYLNEDDTKQLFEHSIKWLQELVDIPEFCCLMSPLMKRKISNLDDLKHYYGMTDDKIGKRLLHCTANYTNKGKAPGSLDYINKEEVMSSLGKCFSLHVVGFVITPRSFGARIKLTVDELILWGQNDDERPKPEIEMLFDSLPEMSEEHDQEKTITESNTQNRSCVHTDSLRVILQDIDELNRFSPTSGIGRRAHLTMGTARNVPPVTTGFDLLRVVAYESQIRRSEESVPTQTFTSPRAVIKCYNNEFWVIYPEMQVELDSLFSYTLPYY